MNVYDSSENKRIENIKETNLKNDLLDFINNEFI
jgi:hypothetical protein